ncbi:1206_t:CDS:2 [Ambispora gerdemannii]|uniref:Protein phosphatase n=1 Tax=Ambispora gerdemannii TaxID=144530 RepID=A0A9N8YMH9_9GLOM|nr:1206_t:CDS:2 [Ambispora gerdemannii]
MAYLTKNSVKPMKSALKSTVSIIRDSTSSRPLQNTFSSKKGTSHKVPSLNNNGLITTSYDYTSFAPLASSQSYSSFSQTSYQAPSLMNDSPLLISRNTLSSHFHTIFRRSFHNCASVPFRGTERTVKPHSSKPRKFLDTSCSIKPNPTTSHSIFDLFDKPFSTARKSLSFSHGASGIPKHPDKLASNSTDGNYFSINCGEDSFFRRHDSLGVADGVGGWRHPPHMEHVVVNSALYSRKLMHYAYKELEKYDIINNEEYYHYDNVNPKQILQTSYDKTLRDCALEGIVGSSTALISVLRGDELRIANLGDCGIIVIRHNDVIFRNEEQQHSFNYPYQLGTGLFDEPSDAQTINVKIKSGDIVVLGSDGLFDNLFDDDIVEEVRRNGLRAQTISDALAWRAKGVSGDLNNVNGSPFQCRASQEGLYHLGGKMDDITVLVAIVTETHDS